MLTQRRVVAAKIEAVEGTPETLTAADGGILVAELKHDIDIEMYKRNIMTGSFSQVQEIPGGQLATFSFKAEMKGPGAAYSLSVLPAIGKYLRACGFAVTVDTTPGSEKATYKPASSGIPCLTMSLYLETLLFTAKGCRGAVKLSGKKGEPIIADFSFQGVLHSVADGAIIAPTFENTIPPQLLGAACTIAGYTPVMSSIGFDMGTKLAPREDFVEAEGYKSVLYVGRDAGGKMDPELTTVADYDWYGKWKAGTTSAFSLGPVGSVQYNKYTITAPKLVKRKVADEDRGGIAVAGTDFQLAMNTGDDELVIEFS